MTAPSALQQPRAIGAGRISVKARAGQSHLDQLRQSGSLKLVFPNRVADVHGIIINTAGGITGGDHFTLSGAAGEDTHLTLSTQAAERVYRAQPPQTATVRTALHVGKGARLHWLPQETILFDGCALHRSLSVTLEDDADFLMVEPLLFGRRAMGEELFNVRFDDRVSVTRAGRLIFRDGMRIRGDAAAQMDRPAIGNGARAMASIVLASASAEAQLQHVRGVIGARGGASLLDRDLMVIRLLASDGFEMRRVLLPLLDHLTQSSLPQSWRL